MDSTMHFDSSMREVDRGQATTILSAVASGRDSNKTPLGYVYRSLYTDGHSYLTA